MLLVLVVLIGAAALSVSADDPSNKILILAQGRSGSTFLSSWFGSLPNVNYFIEPCSMVYGNGIDRDRTGVDCARFIKELFQCDFARANVQRNQTEFIPEKARKAFRGWGHQGNASDVSACQTSRRAHVAKELRMGMAWAHHAVEFDRVIVLFRDPRAIMNSRQADWPKPLRSYTRQDDQVNPHGWNGRTGFPYTQSLRSLCIEHLALRARVAEAKQGVLVMEYSQVLRDSLGLAKRAMDFSGLQQQDLALVQEHVTRNSNGDCVDPDSPFSVCRTNVPAADDKWKRTLSLDTLRELGEIDECVQVVSTYYSSKQDEL